MLDRHATPCYNGDVDKSHPLTEVDAMDGLERVFSVGHEYHDRIFYDAKEGSYYDLATDLYITLEELKSFGFPI